MAAPKHHGPEPLVELNSPLALTIRDRAADGLYALLGAPTPQDPLMVSHAAALLRRFLHDLQTGEASATDGLHLPDTDAVSANVMVLGELDQVTAALQTTDTVEPWGHFLRSPAAHGEAVAAALASDGVARVYIASAWRRPDA